MSPTTVPATSARSALPALDLGPVLDNSTASVSLIAQFTIGPDGHFYVVDANGGRVVRFQGPSGTTPGAPIGSAPFTFITQTGVEDINFGPDGNLYLVVQTGADREVRRYNATTGASAQHRRQRYSNRGHGPRRPVHRADLRHRHPRQHALRREPL
jgi:hypothetical protein